MEKEIFELARRLVAEAARKRVLFSFAESCTGGLAGAAVTEIAGASEVFLGSAVTYCNQAKHNLLGVEEDILSTVGAVSEECARQMAAGSRRIYGADFSMSVTGVAGPDGGTVEKPVGTVWFGFASASGTEAFVRCFSGGRGEVRAASVREMLSFMLGKLN